LRANVGDVFAVREAALLPIVLSSMLNSLLSDFQCNAFKLHCYEQLNSLNMVLGIHIGIVSPGLHLTDQTINALQLLECTVAEGRIRQRPKDLICIATNNAPNNISMVWLAAAQPRRPCLRSTQCCSATDWPMWMLLQANQALSDLKQQASLAAQLQEQVDAMQREHEHAASARDLARSELASVKAERESLQQQLDLTLQELDAAQEQQQQVKARGKLKQNRAECSRSWVQPYHGLGRDTRVESETQPGSPCVCCYWKGRLIPLICS
jgi:hypothetical protein